MHGDQALFERICLEAFQAGLSWRTVLQRRDALREVFEGFDPERLAGWGEKNMSAALQDPRIIRNRAKVRAVVLNAHAYRSLHQTQGSGALDALIWRHAVPDHPRPQTSADVPSRTLESQALATALRQVGFVHIGPVSCYALMQACGLVDDHLAGCPAVEEHAEPVRAKSVPVAVAGDPDRAP